MSNLYNIDSHKLQYHPERVAGWLKEGSYNSGGPIFVEISLSNVCNHNCVFCGLDFINQKKEKWKLNFNKLKESIKSMAEIGVKSIMFAGSCEPLLYKELPSIIEYCAELNIDTALTTNFIPVTLKSLNVYLKHCKWIKVSINGGDRASYNRIHCKDDYWKALDNLMLASELKEQKGYKCTIGTQLVLLDENARSVEKLIAESKLRELNYCVIKPYSQHIQSINSIKIAYKKMMNDLVPLRCYSNDKFKVIFRTDSMVNWDKQELGFDKCYATPNFWAYIEADGNVYPCSVFIGKEKFLLGNINDKTFKDLWLSEKRKEMSEYILNNHDMKECRINCRMKYVNQYLERLVNPSQHDSFI